MPKKRKDQKISKKNPLTPHPGGRPPIPFLERYCEELVEHMAQGLSFETFAVNVVRNDGTYGVGKDTMYKWANTIPQFAEAKKRGEMFSRKKWEEMGIDGLTSGSINAAVYCFMMKNKFGFRDKVEATITENKNVNVNVSVLNASIKELLGVKKEAQKIRDVAPIELSSDE